MSIENVNGMNKFLSNYNSQDWVKSINLDNQSSMPNFNNINAKDGNLSFSEMLSKSLMEVNSMQEEANKAIQKLASGQSKNIHETMLAAEQAEIAFKIMNQIRMKVIDAYKEIMRMQI